MCEETGGSVTGSIGELVGEAPNMIVGGLLGIAAAVTLAFVFENIVWIGLGVAVLAAAGIAWRARCIVREHRAVPQSALWSPGKARTVPRPAIGSAPQMPRPRVRALPEQPKALPAAKPALTQAEFQGLAELAAAILPVKQEAS